MPLTACSMQWTGREFYLEIDIPNLGATFNIGLKDQIIG
jgi:hypothetical protein